MADVAASMLAPAVESAFKKVGAIIKRQFIFLFCFTSNIIGLEDEAKSLNDLVQGVKARVDDEVTNNAREINPQVTSWLQKSKEFIEEESAILNQVPNVTGLRFAARFSLSRRAKKITEAMAQHRQKSSFENMSLPSPAAATKESPLGKTFSFSSRKQIEHDIMNNLRDKKRTMLAIHGMGGLGKTTMAKRIMNALLNEKVFDEVVIAVVSQQVDEKKIQLDIGDSLGLKDLKDTTSPQARAQLLHARLSASTTRTLLVLDDVWEKLVLENLGIPCGSEGCTTLITSRNSDAMRAMNVEFIFEMEQLSEEDAWYMFKERVGTCVDDEKLMSTAKEVMRKCKGLPIALEALGAALRDEKSKSVWRDTLRKLRMPNPRNTPHYIGEVYNPLIVSYDKLDEESKSPFLLCCLFREDDNISIEDLTYYCMGLRLFEDLGSLGEVRDRMWSLVKMLKSRSLLLDGDEEGHVRLHDVVRDVCIFIAKQKRYIGGNDCTWISSSQPLEARTELSTNLRLLFSDRVDTGLEIDDTLFEVIRELSVLSVFRYSWTSLPHTIQSLNHLRILLLKWCHDIETISVIGSLVRLEILICRGCGSIKELPEEMKGLKHLKVLEFTQCDNMESIGRGIISSLVELEELKILYSFDRWKAADLRELEALKKLTCLEIHIKDRALVSQDIELSSKLERFDVRFFVYKSQFPERFNKKLCLWLDEGVHIGQWIRKLMKDAECVDVDWNGANFQNYFSNIQWLKIWHCGGTKSIATISGVLEHLELMDIPQLEEIWNGQSNSLTFLKNLKKITLGRLHALKYLWKSNTNIVSLPQLETLRISGCDMMEQLFLWSEEGESETNRGSPNHDAIKIEFPQLRKMSIEECPKMRSIISTTWLNESGSVSNSKSNIDDHSSHLFCQPQNVSFGCLKELETGLWNPFCHHNHIYVSFFNELEILSISKYNGSGCLFTASIARNLANLKKLNIQCCDKMVSVIEDDKDEGITVSGGENKRPFPKLKELRLIALSKLVSFCSSNIDVELSSLKKLDISSCPTTNLSLKPLALEEVETDLHNYLGVLFNDTRNHPSCSLHETRTFSFVNGLKMLYIQYYRGSTSIFSSSVAENLINLTVLIISYCDEMVKVIGGGERSANLLFPKLKILMLWDLPKLEIFCEWESDVELPLLEELNIEDCPNMTKFTLGCVTTPCLNFVSLGWKGKKYSVDGTTGLNDALQQLFGKEKEINNKDEDVDENRDREGDASNGNGDAEIENATNEACE